MRDMNLRMNPRDDLMWPESDPYALAKYQLLLDRVGEVKGKEILVVGSGNGCFATILAIQGAQVKAIDIDPTPIELTKSAAIQARVAVETEIASLEEYKDQKKYDLVVATDVIEHIENDQNAVGRLKSFCVPNGKLIITVPALSFLFGYHDEILGHYRRYSRGQLKTLLSQFMHLEMLRYYGFLLIPVALLASRILRKPYPTFEKGTQRESQSFIQKIASFVTQVEKRFRPPLGTSLLAVGVVKDV